MKKRISLLLVIAMLFTCFLVSGCTSKATPEEPAAKDAQKNESKAEEETLEYGSKAPEEYEATLTIMAHSKQLEDVTKRFMEKYPNIKIEWDIIPGKEHLQQITNRVASQELPDIMTFKTPFAKYITNVPNCYANISEAPFKGEEIAEKMVPYTVDLSRDQDGNLRGLTWQATVGGIYYRRSVAQEYFGFDDPEKVNDLFSSWDKVIETGRTLNEKSGGKVKLFNSYIWTRAMFLNQREQGWVDENGKFYYDETIIKNFFEVSKTLYDEGLVHSASAGDSELLATMQDGSVFGYVFPTWGLNFRIQPNAPETAGDWGLALPPSPYIWGGTFLGITHNTKHPEEAWLLFDFILNDTESLTKYALDDGDYVANMEVTGNIAKMSVEELKDVPAIKFMGGQNIFDFYNGLVEQGVKPELISEYDDVVVPLLELACISYVEEGKTMEEALQKFEDEVYSYAPELK